MPVTRGLLVQIPLVTGIQYHFLSGRESSCSLINILVIDIPSLVDIYMKNVVSKGICKDEKVNLKFLWLIFVVLPDREVPATTAYTSFVEGEV